MLLEGLGQLKKIHLIGTRTCDLPACSIVPQPTVKLNTFLISALDASGEHLLEVLLTPRETAPSNYWRGGWVSPRVGLDAGGKKEKYTLLPGIKIQFPNNPANRPVTILNDPQI
jgi:hypothetical protein